MVRGGREEVKECGLAQLGNAPPLRRVVIPVLAGLLLVLLLPILLLHNHPGAVPPGARDGDGLAVVVDD